METIDSDCIKELGSQLHDKEGRDLIKTQEMQRVPKIQRGGNSMPNDNSGCTWSNHDPRRVMYFGDEGSCHRIRLAI